MFGHLLVIFFLLSEITLRPVSCTADNVLFKIQSFNVEFYKEEKTSTRETKATILSKDLESLKPLNNLFG